MSLEIHYRSEQDGDAWVVQEYRDSNVLIRTVATVPYQGSREATENMADRIARLLTEDAQPVPDAAETPAIVLSPDDLERVQRWAARDMAMKVLAPTYPHEEVEEHFLDGMRMKGGLIAKYDLDTNLYDGFSPTTGKASPRSGWFSSLLGEYS